MQLSGPAEIKKLKIQEAAAQLNVSPATLRNWLRSGLLVARKNKSQIYIDQQEVQKLKKKILQGTVFKLRKRANKNRSEVKHGHSELLKHLEQEPLLLKQLKQHQGKTQFFLLALYVLQLQEAGLCDLQKANLNLDPKSPLAREIKAWGVDLHSNSFRKTLNVLQKAGLNLKDNLLSYSYQYLCDVGTKQKAGAYYTPPALVKTLVQSVLTQKGPVFDPCCGSGHFLIECLAQLQALKVSEPWSFIYGADIDERAVLIARATLTLASGGKAHSVRQIRQQDSLIKNEHDLQFRYILTNPPWGAQFDLKYRARLKKTYPQIKSQESFAYFIEASLPILQKDGVLGFVLPDSFLNVKAYANTRKRLIQNYQIKKIKRCEQKFSGVFTKTFMIEIRNCKPDQSSSFEVDNGLSVYQKSYADFKVDDDCVIAIDSDHESETLIKKIESRQVTTLKGQSDWALGVVTGQNEKFLRSTPRQGFEPVYKGSDVLRFRLSSASRYLLWAPQQLQQVAPLQLYRCPEKLVYRFICKELVFAVDRSGAITLNSANVLIPQVPGYSLRALCGVLNSVVAQFYYQKKFNTLKTLRSNLEKLPLPKPQKPLLQKIEKVVERLESSYSQESYNQLNELVMDLYELPAKSRRPLRSFKLTSSFDLKS